MFVVAGQNLSKHPTSLLAVLVHKHRQSGVAGQCPPWYWDCKFCSASVISSYPSSNINHQSPPPTHPPPPVDPVLVDGNPKHFQLVLDYLRHDELPVVESTAELQWLERQAGYYLLHQLKEL